MSLKVEIMRNVLLESFREWLEANKSAIGEKWYKKLEKKLERARINNETELIAYALWMYNIVSNFAVKSHISRRGVAIHSVPRSLDEKTTKRLLTAIQMSIW